MTINSDATARRDSSTGPRRDDGAARKGDPSASLVLRHRFRAALERLGLVVLLAAMIGVFSALEPQTFATGDNWRVIASSQAVTLVIALALQLPLAAGHFDLSVGSVAVASAILAAKLMSEHETSLAAAMAAAVIFGLLVGLVNGIAVTVFRVDGIIATLGTGTILIGLVSWYSEQRAIAIGISPTLVDFGFSDFLGVPRVVIIAIVIALLVAYLQEATPLGRKMAAIGSNASSARLVGIRVDATTMLAYILSAALGSLAGILMLAQQGSADPSLSGLTVLLPALAAVFLGTAAFFPGRFNVPGTIIGLTLVSVLISGLTLVGADIWVQPVANGAALLAAVAMTSYLRRHRSGTA